MSLILSCNKDFLLDLLVSVSLKVKSLTISSENFDFINFFYFNHIQRNLPLSSSYSLLSILYMAELSIFDFFSIILAGFTHFNNLNLVQIKKIRIFDQVISLPYVTKIALKKEQIYQINVKFHNQYSISIWEENQIYENIFSLINPLSYTKFVFLANKYSKSCEPGK